MKMNKPDCGAIFAVLSFLGFLGVFAGAGMGDAGAPLGQCAAVSLGSLAAWVIFAKLAGGFDAPGGRGAARGSPPVLRRIQRPAARPPTRRR